MDHMLVFVFSSFNLGVCFNSVLIRGLAIAFLPVGVAERGMFLCVCIFLDVVSNIFLLTGVGCLF